MQSALLDTLVGEAKVMSTQGRGMTPEEIANLALDKILHVADTAHPLLKEQARAFKEDLRKILVLYMKQAIKSDRTTLYNKLRDAGQTNAANIITKI